MTQTIGHKADLFLIALAVCAGADCIKGFANHFYHAQVGLLAIAADYIALARCAECNDREHGAYMVINI